MSSTHSPSNDLEDKAGIQTNIISKEEVQEKGYKIVRSKDADATLKFQEQYDSTVPEITPEQEAKLSRKVTWIIMSLVCLANLLLYMDKATLSYASIFEFWDDTGLDQDKYNNVNTIFYVGYIAGQLPGNYLLAKLPVGRFLFILTSLWTIIIFLHCAAFNYAGVIVLRFFLGFVESVVLTLLNITMGQFLTAKEKAATAPIFYSTCLGVTIPTGFIAYGVLFAKSSIHAWRIFMIIIGGLTFLLTVLVFLIYPNNPSTAKFLSIEERIWVIRRVQSTTGASIEQKTFKKYQFIEALKDPITWLFASFIFLQQLANNLPYQQNLLFKGMGGISNLNSTLVSVASGGFAVICCLIASFFLYRFANITAYSVVFWSLPSFVGSIVAAALPWSNKVGLLAALSLASPVFGIPWICMFSWNSTSCSGHTKKITRNAVIMFWYCIANIISPQLWTESSGPRYYPAWAVQIVLSFFTAPLLALVIRFILNKRNQERLSNLSENQKVGVVEDSDVEFVVNVASLDLTDLENKAFIYPL
ncbi:putative transporter [Wickerhamomyces ciferrii]|uniref:Transporter n=1 Tax=Wickerhamomyces ciferrii (strain ATCC 14091 / BCRC 22168 / CBS 111 / JCM 3599 / NBRC 0793 / NRRL Y-1031 F-60-10) TaxID=1206466 RepID=K0KMY3_WICCF|nr:putative transporter [Wickerhamomyces ciferrii]CCH44311.1 putative transporter [Wickerhamomyces ciferrii]